MIGYLDLPSGISGDMLLGCLVDCGWSADRLRKTVESLPLSSAEWAIEIKQVLKGSLRATSVSVLVEEGRHQRRLSDVAEIINGSTLVTPVKQKALAIFGRLAEAEARVHGTHPDQIHFHEVGAVDAIIDIVGSVAGLQELGVDQLYASALPLGPGWAQTAHGRLPMPAPATLQLLSTVHAPTRKAPGPGELVTPTGAAILAELAIFEQPAMRLNHIGLGAGQRDCAWPNIARLWLGEPEGAAQLVQMETNIDDMNPQLYSDLVQSLLDAGALDVWLTPVQMKKGRPGTVVSILASTSTEAKLSDLLLRQSTTLGVRVHAIQHRHEARREIREVITSYGTVRVKVKWVGQDAIDAVPEFEDCRVIAGRDGVALMSVHQAAVVAGQNLLAQLRGVAKAEV